MTPLINCSNQEFFHDGSYGYREIPVAKRAAIAAAVIAARRKERMVTSGNAYWDCDSHCSWSVGTPACSGTKSSPDPPIPEALVRVKRGHQ